MFIKILTPNSNGNIELTVNELENLIRDAVDKAIREKCSSCNRSYFGQTIPLNCTGGIVNKTDTAHTSISNIYQAIHREANNENT